MRTFTCLAVLALLVCGTSVIACENDSQTPVYEQQFQEQYEPQPVLADDSSANKPVLAASMGAGGALLLGSLGYSLLRRRA